MFSKGDRVRDVTWPDKFGTVKNTALDYLGNTVQVEWDDGVVGWRYANGVTMLKLRPNVIGLVGYAQSGKDTFADFLVNNHGYIRVSFADALRDSLYALNPIVDHNAEDWGVLRLKDAVDGIGWDRAKVEIPEIRTLLQRMGTEVGRQLLGENVWVDIVKAKMTAGNKYVVTDVRFPNEVHAVKDLGGELIRVVRPGIGAVNRHSSETALDSYSFFEVTNNGTLNDLERAARAIATAVSVK